MWNDGKEPQVEFELKFVFNYIVLYEILRYCIYCSKGLSYYIILVKVNVIINYLILFQFNSLTARCLELVHHHKICFRVQVRHLGLHLS